MKVAIIAPFFDKTNIDDSIWIDDYVTSGAYEFHHIPRSVPMPKWHDRKSKLTSVDEWMRYMRQVRDAFHLKPDVVVPVFPQLAACAGVFRRFSRNTKVLAWMFNVGTVHEGARRRLARLALSHVDLFVVHTRREIAIYSEWLNLPAEKFVFVPYQSAEIEVLEEEETEAPFMAAMGSAHRDYGLLSKVVGDLGIPTVIASSQAAVDGIDLPDCIQTPFGISKEECLRLTQRARVNVIPLKPKPKVTAAGQVTLVEAMIMGKALVATEYYGVEDYLKHEVTGLLVKPNSQDELHAAIARLWNDADLRHELGANARKYALENSSDDAAARALDRYLAALAPKAHVAAV